MVCGQVLHGTICSEAGPDCKGAPLSLQTPHVPCCGKLVGMKSKSGKASKKNSGGLVYSTEVGRTCPGCLRGLDACVCKARHNTVVAAEAAAGDGVVRLHRETKGRKGKGVTLVRGVVLAEAELLKLAKVLKAGCGVGGAVKDGVIELQTADREKVKALLEGKGFAVKVAGG